MTRLTIKALTAINEPRTRTLLALALDCTDNTIRAYIKNNSDNLTKAAALAIIRQETGFNEEEILEDEPVGTINESHKANS